MKNTLFTRTALLVMMAMVSTIAMASDRLELYPKKNFRGEGEWFQASDENLRDNIIGNDRLSSIRIPRGCTVYLYEHTGFRGEVLVLRKSVKNLNRTTMGNNQVSSIRVEWDRQQGRALPTRRNRAAAKLYAHVGFEGRKEVLFEDCADLRGSVLGNDQVSSLRVPPGYEVIVYEHTHYRGRWEAFTYDDDNLRDNRIGNDRISSVRIRKLPAPQRRHEGVAGAVLFDKRNFRGRSLRVTGSIENLGRTPLGNDSVTAIEVPRGYAVTLYTHKDFKGRSETFYESDYDLSDNWIGDNRVTSVRVVWMGDTRHRQPRTARRTRY